MIVDSLNALDTYYEYALEGTEMFPVFASALTTFMLIGGLLALGAMLFPFFILGLIFKRKVVEERLCKRRSLS